MAWAPNNDVELRPQVDDSPDLFKEMRLAVGTWNSVGRRASNGPWGAMAFANYS